MIPARSGLNSDPMHNVSENNELYVPPENVDYHPHPKDHPKTFFDLISGPSTSFYVGPQNKHYTIPKRLIYHFSACAKAGLEGQFSEAAANAIWLGDVDPKIFQFLWRWLYTGEIEVHLFLGMERGWWDIDEQEQRGRECQLLCQVEMLGERLLFDGRLYDAIGKELDALIELGGVSLFTPEIVHDIFSNSAPVQYCSMGQYYYQQQSLKALVLHHWSCFDSCTAINYYEYIECFEQDGAFAAQVMLEVVSEIGWAVERWGAQVGSTIDVNEKKEQVAKERGGFQWIERREGKRDGVCLACRYMCTFTGCTTTDFRTYSRCFVLDGVFAAEILSYMREELLWILDRWGIERGSSVDLATERYDEEQEELLQSMADKNYRRQGWS